MILQSLSYDIPKGMWLKLLQGQLHTHVYCSAIHNSQVMEIAKMLHYWQMDQENVVSIHNAILLSHEEKWNLIIRKKMDGTGEYHTERG
jgi:hypothetical protein